VSTRHPAINNDEDRTSLGNARKEEGTRRVFARRAQCTKVWLYWPGTCSTLAWHDILGTEGAGVRRIDRSVIRYRAPTPVRGETHQRNICRTQFRPQPGPEWVSATAQ
jgi:hypothetical protein